MNTDEVIDQLTEKLAEPDISAAQFDELVNRINVLKQMRED